MTGWATILAAARAECETFERACGAPRAAQLALLRRIVADNSASVFGRAHGFDRIDSVAAFRAQVPIRDYDALRPWIDRAAVGEAAILTAAPIVAFEETGGTTSGRKLIPYSQAGLAAFRAAVLPWLDDLARQRPSTLEGSAYVSLSPVARVPRVTAGGIPIGLPSEYGYLGADLAAALASVLAVPAAVGLVRDLEHWRLLTLRWLVQAADLSFISVWSPTFLTGLIEALPGLAEPLARAVHDGAGVGEDTAVAGTVELLPAGVDDAAEVGADGRVHGDRGALRGHPHGLAVHRRGGDLSGRELRDGPDVHRLADGRRHGGGRLQEADDRIDDAAHGDRAEDADQPLEEAASGHAPSRLGVALRGRACAERGPRLACI